MGGLQMWEDAARCGGPIWLVQPGIPLPTASGLGIPAQATPGSLPTRGVGHLSTLGVGRTAQAAAGDGVQAASGMDCGIILRLSIPPSGQTIPNRPYPRSPDIPRSSWWTPNRLSSHDSPHLTPLSSAKTRRA